MKGRPRKPTKIKQLAGTLRKHRQNGDEPQPPAGMPPAPAHLDATAKAEYERVGKLLLACRVVTQAELAALSCYSQAWSRMIEAEGKLKETGLVVKSPAGFPCISPYLSIAVKAGEEIRKWAAELGLTPASRSRVKALPAAIETTGRKRFFKKAE